MEPGSLVLVNCIAPKEQIWGRLESLGTAGVTVRGIDLRSLEDWMRQMRRPEEERTLGLVTMFVPMTRVERIFLDERVGQVPSYREQFRDLTGQPVESFLDPHPPPAADRPDAG